MFSIFVYDNNNPAVDSPLFNIKPLPHVVILCFFYTQHTHAAFTAIITINENDFCFSAKRAMLI